MNVPMIRSWGEQRSVEIGLRRQWLQDVVRSGLTRRKCAKSVGLNIKLFNAMLIDFNVKFPVQKPKPRHKKKSMDVTVSTPLDAMRLDAAKCNNRFAKFTK